MNITDSLVVSFDVLFEYVTNNDWLTAKVPKPQESSVSMTTMMIR